MIVLDPAVGRLTGRDTGPGRFARAGGDLRRVPRRPAPPQPGARPPRPHRRRVGGRHPRAPRPRALPRQPQQRKAGLRPRRGGRGTGCAGGPRERQRRAARPRRGHRRARHQRRGPAPRRPPARARCRRRGDGRRRRRLPTRRRRRHKIKKDDAGGVPDPIALERTADVLAEVVAALRPRVGGRSSSVSPRRPAMPPARSSTTRAPSSRARAATSSWSTRSATARPSRSTTTRLSCSGRDGSLTEVPEGAKRTVAEAVWDSVVPLLHA